LLSKVADGLLLGQLRALLDGFAAATWRFAQESQKCELMMKMKNELLGKNSLSKRAQVLQRLGMQNM